MVYSYNGNVPSLLMVSKGAACICLSADISSGPSSIFFIVDTNTGGLTGCIGVVTVLPNRLLVGVDGRSNVFPNVPPNLPPNLLVIEGGR